jgi:hypothetical protein
MIGQAPSTISSQEPVLYVPTPEMILDVPMFNSFYRAPSNVSILVSNIANQARNNAGLDRSYIWKTIRAMCGSIWNKSHIEYSTRGYENYNIEGIQYSKKYGSDPLALPGSGTQYPVVWIPDPDSPLEPSAIFAPMETVSVPIKEKEIPLDVIEEIVDPQREVIYIEPITQEAAEIAASVESLPTQSEAAVIQEAVNLSTQAKEILEDPYATDAEKEAAINNFIQLAEEGELLDEKELLEAKGAAIAIQEARQEDQAVQEAISQTKEPSAFDALAPLLASFLAARFMA